MRRFYLPDSEKNPNPNNPKQKPTEAQTNKGLVSWNAFSRKS